MPFDYPVLHTEVNNTTIAYRTAGTGDALVMLHGWPLWGATFRKLLPDLAQRFTCYIPDIPGGGDTLWTAQTDFSWPGQAATIKAWIDRLGLTSYHLLGQNSGAMVGRQLALMDPGRLRKFAMTNTEIPNHRPPFLPLYRNTIGKIPKPILQKTFSSQKFLRSAAGFGGSFYDKSLIGGEFFDLFIKPLVESKTRLEGHVRFLQGWDFDLLDQMAQLHRNITAPVALFWGENDPTFPIERAEEMSGQFPNSSGVTRIPLAQLFVQEERADLLSGELLQFYRL